MSLQKAQMYVAQHPILVSVFFAFVVYLPSNHGLVRCKSVVQASPVQVRPCLNHTAPVVAPTTRLAVRRS